MCYLTNNGYDQSHCTSQAGVFSYYFFIHYLSIPHYYLTTLYMILDNFHIFAWFLLQYSHVLPHFHRFYSALDNDHSLTISKNILMFSFAVIFMCRKSIIVKIFETKRTFYFFHGFIFPIFT